MSGLEIAQPGGAPTRFTFNMDPHMRELGVSLDFEKREPLTRNA
jgi:hypothetical protein